jgi:hypothetical protein
MARMPLQWEMRVCDGKNTKAQSQANATPCPILSGPHARSVLREISILETEVSLLSLAPGALPVEVDVYALFVFVRDRLRF